MVSCSRVSVFGFEGSAGVGEESSEPDLAKRFGIGWLEPPNRVRHGSETMRRRLTRGINDRGEALAPPSISLRFRVVPISRGGTNWMLFRRPVFPCSPLVPGLRAGYDAGRSTRSSMSPGGPAVAMRNPWARSQPRAMSSSSWACDSTPSATTAIPRAWERSMIEATMARSVAPRASS